MISGPASIASTSSVELGSLTDLRRRAEGPGGEALDLDPAFDADTLFYDVCQVPGGQVVALGPPLFDLEQALDLSFDLPSIASRPLDRQHQLWLGGRADTIRVRSREGGTDVPVSGPDHEVFAGRRVLLTLSRDNPIDWILDWARFHRDRHGADAVLLYDNSSSAYAVEDLAAALGRLEGFRASVVVPWPFPYGPYLPPRYEHSYCQLGVLEHARWRFLQRARSVMNGDVDELVLAPRPGLFRLAEMSPFGTLRYHGRWVHDVDAGIDPSPVEGQRRHRDFTTVLRRSWQVRRWHGVPRPVVANRSAAKWTVVPRRVPWQVQWRIHDLFPSRSGRSVAPTVSFRHFRPLSTNWKYDRTRTGPYDPALHGHDRRLERALARVDWDR